ncbi:hypothetical protein V6M85_09300 [Sulfolobus tengchongensis]|uniref:Uncharacterized protein n=1 Tax=Sulfolobus tengchongensis TaxID=207809 RepID=A0AAX4KYC7_9CREN
METEIRRLLDKAERIVEKCVSCGNSNCDECDEARELLDEIRDKINSIQDKRLSRRLSVMLDDLESKLESIE